VAQHFGTQTIDEIIALIAIQMLHEIDACAPEKVAVGEFHHLDEAIFFQQSWYDFLIIQQGNVWIVCHQATPFRGEALQCAPSDYIIRLKEHLVGYVGATHA
jgi:hypothetical protein